MNRIRKLSLEEVRELIRTDGPWPEGYRVDYRPDGTVLAVRGNPYRGGSSFIFAQAFIPEDVVEVTIP